MGRWGSGIFGGAGEEIGFVAVAGGEFGAEGGLVSGGEGGESRGFGVDFAN